MKKDGCPPDPGRRRALGTLATASALAAVGGLELVACAEPATEAPPDPITRVALDSVPVGRRTTIAHRGEPVEVIRTAEGVTARGLTCTHFGCEVAWLDDSQIYQCPCHNARFDAAGRVMFGPPNRPLRAVPARIEGGEIVLGEPAAG